MVGTWIVLIPVLVAVSLVYTPRVWVDLAMLVDFYTPWILFESPMYEKYHHFLLSRLEEREEMPIPIITPEQATPAYIREISRGYTFPVVIKGMFKNASSIDTWNDPNWWLDNYATEEVLCGTLAQVVEDCTVGKFFSELEAGHPFYISGASVIFDKHHELHEMIDNEKIRSIEPGPRTATQIFMGVTDMGSDIHAAIGVNIFRQVVGRKKWWFIPPSQTPYLKPSINVNGFSAHTQTLVGKMGEKESPWLKKIERYTTVVESGDVLINPPWFWHGILNLGETPTDLVIGAPSRYGGKEPMIGAFKSNAMMTVNALLHLVRKYGSAALKPGFKINLQTDIANNRRDRDKVALVEDKELHPFDFA